ncbi:hypothetical protein ALC60_05727 [Trachymyrmex zeteki]|uniref:Uncharacterized protein n=1 Tax=Mycetomoellerius zeteki TaxID=64791 RepID=A0A151X553_9HYME|nr:hypothetical protein ALC60_05727 [Trachymyrmex zeteki]
MVKPKRVVKLLRITSGLCSVISLWLRFKSVVSLTLLILKCAFRAVALLTIFLTPERFLYSEMELGTILAANSSCSRSNLSSSFASSSRLPTIVVSSFSRRLSKVCGTCFGAPDCILAFFAAFFAFARSFINSWHFWYLRALHLMWLKLLSDGSKTSEAISADVLG